VNELFSEKTFSNVFGILRTSL